MREEIESSSNRDQAAVAGLRRPRVSQVLVVEDQPEQRRALARCLAHAGYVVTTAGSFAEGLRVFAGQECVLMDIDLGDGSGLALGELLLEGGKLRRLVFYTACADRRVLAHAARLGTVVEKPVRLSEVLRALR